MRLRIYRPGEAPEKTVIHLGMIGMICMGIALMIGDGFWFAFAFFILESIWLTYKTNKDRMKQ